jgi:hypothetical protein
MPSAARIGNRAGILAVLSGLGALAAVFTGHFDAFWLFAKAAALLGFAAIVFGLAGVAVSRGERRLGAVGVLLAVLVIGLPVLFIIALIEAFSHFEG